MNTSTSTCITSLPRDILLEILSGLPPKSVVRFRCISKFFYSFIPKPHLAFRILLSTPSIKRALEFYTMSYTEESQGKLQANSSVQYLDVLRFGGFVDSSFADGKIFLSDHSGKAALCDLSTRQHISLPRTWGIYCTCAVLGFDSVSKRYKVFKSEMDYCLAHRHWVLTLGVDESWREIINSFIPSYFDASVHIDGIIYLIQWTMTNKPEIVAFDVGTENFSTISFSCEFQPCYDSIPRYSPWLKLNNQLTFISISMIDLRSKINVWTLEKSTEWEKHMVPLPLEVNQVIGQASPRGITTNSMGEIVFLIQGRMSPLILLYAFGRQVWRKFEICGLYKFLPVYGELRSFVHFIEESVSFLE